MTDDAAMMQQVKSMVQAHHERLHKIDKHIDGSPDSATLRAMEHVHKELPSTDDIKAAVSHSKASAGAVDAVIKSFLAHLGKLLWIIIGAAALAWYKGVGI